jgi:hypothetical protein
MRMASSKDQEVIIPIEQPVKNRRRDNLIFIGILIG